MPALSKYLSFWERKYREKRKIWLAKAVWTLMFTAVCTNNMQTNSKVTCYISEHWNNLCILSCGYTLFQANQIICHKGSAILPHVASDDFGWNTPGHKFYRPSARTDNHIPLHLCGIFHASSEPFWMVTSSHNIHILTDFHQMFI